MTPKAWWRRLAPRGRGRGLGAGLVFSVCMGLAFPPVGWWVFALVAAGPLMWAAWSGGARGGGSGERGAGGRDGAQAAWGPAFGAMLGTLPFWAWTHHWVWSFAPPGAVGLTLHLALFPAVFVWVGRRMSARLGAWWWLAAPVVWVGVEWLRGAVLWGGYPWYFVGHPLIEWAWGAGAARVVGAVGVSLLVACLSAGAAAAAAGAVRMGTALALSAAVVWGALAWRPSEPGAAREVRLAAVQTNVVLGVRQRWTPMRKLADLERFLELTEQAATDAGGAPALIAWPETIFPGLGLQADAVEAERRAGLIWFDEAAGFGLQGFERLMWRGARGGEAAPFEAALEAGDGRVAIPTTVTVDSLLEAQRRLGVPMLVGNDGFDGLRIDAAGGEVSTEWDDRFNSVFLVDHGRVADARYDKRHLTPFGEVMPLIELWPWLEERMLALGLGASGMRFDLSRGRSATLFEIGGAERSVRVMTPVCFEATMSGVCRALALDGSGLRRADALVQVTNDSWFAWFDPGRAVHAQLARWRGVELGVPVVRAANTGVSGVWDARGRAVVTLGPRIDGAVVASVALAGPTLYGRVGDLTGWMCLLGLGVAAAMAIWPQRRNRA